ncbi:uncharacterized protein C1orf232 [Cyprinodon tularosa]|uniref:uncharacterized protein C1orf232 n=1 Tax=Cyprinodon tularosa TaxID=77115 RepID=UPI0018E269A7|nr:uncharacterized protein C1orf232 [Cyprinodon tularosa]
MNPMWKIYKSKVMKTLDPEYEEDTAEEVTEGEHDTGPIQEDEGPNAVSQLARKMQGAGAKSWNRFSSLFNKEDEHQLLEETESPPVADHPLAVKPEEPPPRPNRRTGFWDSFATNWAAKKQAETAAAAATAASDGDAQPGEEGEMQAAVEEQQDEQSTTEEKDEGSSNSFSKYVSLGGGSEEASFKWNFVTSKLAEMKSKGMVNKTN